MSDALETAFAYDGLVIAEAHSAGLEVECSVIGNSDTVASVPGEIVLAGGEGGWYDYEAKYTPGGMRLEVPARIPEPLADRVRELAVEVFLRAGCAGLARVDFFVDVAAGRVLVNELNTIPGFTQTSVYGALFAASGIPYAELLDRLVQLAIERHERERAHRSDQTPAEAPRFHAIPGLCSSVLPGRGFISAASLCPRRRSRRLSRI